MVSGKRRIRYFTAMAASGVLFSGLAFAGGGHHNGHNVDGELDGFQTSPSIITTGTGTVQLQISGDTISYTLNYADLSGPATAAHIHFGNTGVNGGPMAFLCGGGPTNKPSCPSTGANGGSGTISGTITAADVLAIPGQEPVAQDFAGLVGAISNGSTYVNVHTANSPAGEIRGQIGN